MTTIEIAEKIVTEGTAHLYRPTKGAPHSYDAKPYGGGNKRGWVILDLFSAGAIVSVAKAVSETNRAKINQLSPLSAALFCFKVIKSAEQKSA